MKILAAGKTSTERAVLSVARELGLEIGGRCLKGQNYHECVAANSANAEATIVLTRSRYPQVKTERYTHRTPSPAFGYLFLCNADREIPKCREWFCRDRVRVLHVTGHVPFSEAKKILWALLQNDNRA